jgi:hypothetical protein
VSILKHGEHGSDILLFGELIDKNSSFLEVKYINRAVDLLVKKSVRLGRNESTFRSIKLNLPEIVKMLSKIFGKKLERKFDNKSVQTRIREFFQKSHSGLIMIETAMYQIEIEDSKNFNSAGNYDSDIYNIETQEDPQPADRNPAEDPEETDPKARAKNFYSIKKIFKDNDIDPLSKKYLTDIREYQDVKNKYLPETFLDAGSSNIGQSYSRDPDHSHSRKVFFCYSKNIGVVKITGQA